MNINTKSTHDIQGFEALIDSRMEYPLMSGEKILIRPGHAVGKFQCICTNNLFHKLILNSIE